MISSERFDRIYFEDGIRTGKSLYEHYHWIPERSLVEAHWFVNCLDVSLGSRVLDFGCAKGFFVKAMHLLGYNKTYGYDTSRYALRHADAVAKPFLFSDHRKIHAFDYGYCKDVLEHCYDPDHLRETLRMMTGGRRWLVIVPSARNGQYIIPDYELDTTHCIRFSEEEWGQAISEFFTIDAVQLKLHGFKQKWTDEWPEGNLFYRLTVR